MFEDTRTAIYLIQTTTITTTTKLYISMMKVTYSIVTHHNIVRFVAGSRSMCTLMLHETPSIMEQLVTVSTLKW